MGLKQEIQGARDGLADLARRIDDINIPHDPAPASGGGSPAGMERRMQSLEGQLRRVRTTIEGPVRGLEDLV